MGVGVRRQGRRYALQVLYAIDLGCDELPAVAAANYHSEFGLDVDERAVVFACELVTQVTPRVSELDETIQSASKNWRVDRMARVDRNILRLAVYELSFCPDVPDKVVINEAVELAKRFGADNASAFVNGILDRAAQQRS